MPRFPLSGLTALGLLACLATAQPQVASPIVAEDAGPIREVRLDAAAIAEIRSRRAELRSWSSSWPRRSSTRTGRGSCTAT